MDQYFFSFSQMFPRRWPIVKHKEKDGPFFKVLTITWTTFGSNLKFVWYTLVFSAITVIFH